MQLDHGVGVRERDLPWVDIGVRPGYNQRYQGFFDHERGVSARIGSLYAEPYYHSPRHRHTFQQVRYVHAGKMKYGKHVYDVGDCLYIPEGAYYGPISPVTKGTDEQLHFVDIQFEGPSGIPYPEPDDVVAAQRQLAATGKFEEGIYTFPDGRKRDAYEAILEQLTGERISYPPARLGDYVVMRSGACPYRAHPSLGGVQQKHLGYFFECGPNLKVVHVDAGAGLPGATAHAHRAVFLLHGDCEFGGEHYDALSFFMLPHGEPYAAFVAQSACEFLVVAWNAPGLDVPFELF